MTKLVESIKKIGFDISFCDETAYFGNSNYTFSVDELKGIYVIVVYDEVENAAVDTKFYKSTAAVVKLVKSYLKAK